MATTKSSELDSKSLRQPLVLDVNMPTSKAADSRSARASKSERQRTVPRSRTFNSLAFDGIYFISMKQNFDWWQANEDEIRIYNVRIAEGNVTDLAQVLDALLRAEQRRAQAETQYHQAVTSTTSRSSTFTTSKDHCST